MDASLAARPPSPAAAFIKRSGVSVIAFIVWLEVALPRFLAAISAPAKLFLTTDDAMRLSEVRDLLAGQSWFDLTQWRMNVPYGVPMHWSRLIDAPIAGLILFFREFLPPHMAETVAICFWPLLPLLAAWIAIGRIAQRLAGSECGLIAVMLAAACTSIFGYFRPGEIDHHGVHVALTLWTVAFLIDAPERPWAAAGAAIMSAISLAIGIETLPYILATATFIAILWVVRGEDAAKPTRIFSLTFAAMALVILFGATATHERFAGACDTFSGFYAALAVAGGIGLWGATYLLVLGKPMWMRASAFLGIGLILFAITLAIAPQCLGGPYANMDPRLGPVFLSRIAEAKSPFTGLHGIGLFIGTYVYAAFALAASCATIFLVERDRRLAALTAALFAAIALAITSFQIRGMPFAMLLAVPGLAAAIRLVVLRFVGRGLRAAAASIAAVILFSNIAFIFGGVYLFEGEAHAQMRRKISLDLRGCYLPDSVNALTELPQGRVMAFEDQGPAILAFTKDSVIGGPYHRNAQGILDTYDFFTRPPSAGAAIAARRKLDYVVTCKSEGDYRFYMKEGSAHSLLARLAKGNVPPWLLPLSVSHADANIRIYRVRSDLLPAR